MEDLRALNADLTCIDRLTMMTQTYTVPVVVETCTFDACPMVSDVI